MSLILKGIDLPKDEKKPLRIEIWSNGDVYKDYGYGYEHKEGITVQIPKGHGDIKDINTFVKDKSIYEYIENDVFNKEYSYWIGMGAIYNAPTILEAEGEE